MLEGCASRDLLHCYDLVARRFQRLNGFKSTCSISPVYGFCGTQCRFVYIPVRWPGGISAEINTFSQKSIGSPENTSHIMHAPDIFQHENDRQFFSLYKFIPVFAWKLVHPKFTHDTKIRRTGRLITMMNGWKKIVGSFKLFTT